MNSTILDTFNGLKNDNDSIRVNSGIALLNHLHRYNAKEDDNKELNYALVRLVRSLGSSTAFARRGFYSTLTTFLTTHPEISIEKLLSIMNTQLHPAGNNSKSENADICMGRILLCGTLIRSKLLVQDTIEIQQQVIEILLNAGRQRSYLSLISVIFLNEFIVQLDIKSMKKIVWPILENNICKPWSEQTLDLFYIILVVRDKFPSLIDKKFLKKHFGTEDIIVKESMEDIIKLLMDLPRIISHRHPVVKLFCEKLIESVELTEDCWKHIDQKFIKASKSNEYIAIEILKTLLHSVTNKTVIPLLLSPNFLQHMLKKFSNCKKNNENDILIAFREILHLVASATNDKDIKMKTQLNILKKLILYPTGDLLIEKKTGIKVIQIITGNLKLDGIKKLCELYRNIIENKTAKENTKMEFWTNAERSYTAQLLTRLMGLPETLSDQNWRLEQLIFLFNHGLCEMTNVGTELAPQFKDSFYRALDYKLPKLDDVRNLLSALVHNLNLKLQSDNIRLRTLLSDAALDAWKKVIDLIKKLEKNTKNTEALPIFHTMNLHMGLQLFSDPEMAIMSINELQCCYERLIKKSKIHTKIDNTNVVEKEPHWVEVVVDLLLSLLSRNNHLLRSLVGCVFPHVCPHLTPSAIHQILAVLNVQNNQDILTKEESDDDNSSTVESESNDIDDEMTEEVVLNNEISSEESDSESDNENLDADETLTDRLRMAVQQALGNAATQTDEDVNVDEISDNEGKRLDQSLAAAFKILRQNRQVRSKKQEKTSQALTHFRIRVIDLLDIYLETYPSLAITLDMIKPLFTSLEFCIKDPHQKPLEHRIRVCLKKLSAIKKFKDTINVDDNLIIKVLETLIEKGERSASVCQEMSDKLAECCTFLVRCTQYANLSSEKIVDIYTRNLIAFFKKRDCVLSPILFKGVLQLCWEGNWQLTPILLDFAFNNSIRYFRRSQALELLLIFYNNNRLLNMTNTNHADVRVKLETTLYNNTISTLKELCNQDTNSNGTTVQCNSDVQKKVQYKFVGLLLTLLRVVYLHHLPQVWNWQIIGQTLIMFRSQNVLSKDVKSAYNKLAMQIGAPLNLSSVKDHSKLNDNSTNATSIMLHDNDKQQNIEMLNGKTSDLEKETAYNNNVQKKKKINKSKQKDKQMLKKETCELRTMIMSKNLKPFNFSSIDLPGNQVDINMQVHENGNSDDKFTNANSNKRIHEMENDCGSKRRKRKEQNIDCA